MNLSYLRTGVVLFLMNDPGQATVDNKSGVMFSYTM